MKSERNTFFLKSPRLLSSRATTLLRSTAIRAALAAMVFGCAANAIAGDRDKVAAASESSVDAKVSTATRIKNWLQTGQASWYGLKFQGHKTATGESYDMNALTCAHPTLPLGSWIRVTNLRNRKTILVRVNDRGPSFGSRIVDLSYAAARAVGLGSTGKVKLERVNPRDPEVARTLIAQAQPADTTMPALLPLTAGWFPAR